MGILCDFVLIFEFTKIKSVRDMRNCSNLVLKIIDLPKVYFI